MGGIATTLLLALGFYISLMMFVVYFCMIADPETSPWAMYLTVTLPYQSWDKMQSLVGPKNLKVLEWIGDRMLILLYIFVVSGSWSIIFFYVYPWLESQSYLPHYHKYIGYFVFAACVSSWRMASTCSPGIITASNISKYNHFPYDDLLFCRGQTCNTRNIPKLARSKFDRFKYNENIPRFDHYCGWVYNTIGEENYRWFLLFLLVHVVMCLYGSYCIYQLMMGEVYTLKLHEAVFFNRITGEELPAGNFWIILQYLVNSHMAPAAVLFLIGVMSVALSLFLAYHVYLTSKGMTTNESYKWSDVNKWYKAEKLRYQQALEMKKTNKQNEGGTKSSFSKASAQQTNTKTATTAQSAAAAVTDGDVTCTGGGDGSGSDVHEGVLVRDETDDFDDDDIQDPGPLPKNLYDRGLIENWKEILMPISLRKTMVVRSKRESSSSNSNTTKSKAKAT